LPIINQQEFLTLFAEQIGIALGVKWIPSALTEHEIQVVNEFQNVHLSHDWLEKKVRLK
jgi:hypothetical protein